MFRNNKRKIHFDDLDDEFADDFDDDVDDDRSRLMTSLDDDDEDDDDSERSRSSVESRESVSNDSNQITVKDEQVRRSRFLVL